MDGPPSRKTHINVLQSDPFHPVSIFVLLPMRLKKALLTTIYSTFQMQVRAYYLNLTVEEMLQAIPIAI